MKKREISARLFAIAMGLMTIVTSIPMNAYAEELVDTEESVDTDDPVLLQDDNQEEYNYLDTNMRLSWGVVESGDTLQYQNAMISNWGSQAHDLAISVSSSQMWDMILPSTLRIQPGETISIPIRPNLSSPMWGTGDYSDVITIVGFDSDHCDVTDTVGVNLFVTVEKKIQPWVKNVTVSPSSVSLSQGQSYTFDSYVTCGDGADESVTWTLQGNSSANTVISKGTLYVDNNETSTNMTVIATSNEDPSYRGTAIVTVNKNKCNITTQGYPSNGGSTAGGGSFDAGAPVSVIANPANGFKFEGWYENNSLVSTNSCYTFNCNASRSLVAKFTQNSVRITTKKNIDKAGNISESQTIMYGGNYTLQAKANSGFKFVGWYEGNNLVSNSETYNMVGITSSRELTAVFQQTVFNILVNATPQEGGSIVGNGNYSIGSNVDLTAKVANGYEFVGWIWNNQTISSDTTITIKNLDRDYALTAVFKPKATQKTYTIQASAGNGGTISPGGSIPAIEGKSVVFSISANGNFRIVDVKVDGKSQGAISAYTFYDVRDNHSIVASFEAIPKAAETKKETTTTTPTVNVTGAKEKVTTQKPTVDEAHISDEVTEVTSLTGTLQDMNVTPDEARAYIESGNDRTLMEAALVRGDLQVTVFNKYSTPANETTTISYYDITSIPNMEDVVDSLLTEEDKITLFEGNKVRTNLNISNLELDQVNEMDRASLEQNSIQNNVTLDSFFDVRFIEEVNGMPALVTELNTPLRIVMNVPESMKAGGNGSYCVMRMHNGEFSILEDLDSNPDTVTFETDKMSTFALGYYASANTETIAVETLSNDGINNDVPVPDTTVKKDNTGMVVGIAIGVIFLGMIAIIAIVVSSSDKKHRRRKRR